MSSKVYRKTGVRASSVQYRIRGRSMCQACGKRRGSARYSTEEYALLCAHCSQQQEDKKGVGMWHAPYLASDKSRQRANLVVM